MNFNFLCQSASSAASANPPRSAVVLTVQQLRQPRDVDGDPPRLVLREHLRLQRFGIVVAGVEVRERLPVGIPDDIAARDLVGAPGSPNLRRFPPSRAALLAAETVPSRVLRDLLGECLQGVISGLNLCHEGGVSQG